MAQEINRQDEKFTLSSTDYLFMLAKGGSPGGSSSSPFAPKSTIGERTYADYDPYSYIAFTDLSGGMGQEKATDPTKYYDAHNADCRGGRITLGPYLNENDTTPNGLSSVSLTTLATATGGSWVGIGTSSYQYIATKFVCPTGYTSARRAWIPFKATLASGAVTLAIYTDHATNHVPDAPVASASGGLATAYKTPYGQWVEVVFSTKPALTPGTTYWVVVRHQGAVATAWWYGTTTGGGATDTYYSDNGSSWTVLANYHMVFWMDCDTLHTDGPMRLLTGAGEDGISRVWGYTGRRVAYLDSAGVHQLLIESGSTVFEADADIQDAVFFESAADSHPWLWVALGDATDMARFDCNIGSEAHEHLTGHQARRLALHDHLLWWADERNQVGAFDGTNWGSAVSVGDKTYVVRNMVSWNGDLFCGKDDGLYKVGNVAGYPSSGTITCTKVLDFLPLAHTNNFCIMLVHQGDLIFSLGEGLVKYTVGDVLTPITPEVGLTQSTPVYSWYKAAASAVGTLWVTLEAGPGGYSTLLAYAEGHWHPVADLPRFGDMIRGLCVEPGWYGQYPRLWFSCGLNYMYVEMPTETQRRWRWFNNTLHVCAASGYVDLSWVDGGVATVSKDWIECELDCKHVYSATDPGYVKVYWRPDEATAWAQLTGAIVTDGLNTVTFPASSYGARCQLRVELIASITNDYTFRTPQVLGIVLRYMERPDDSQAFTRTYVLAPRQQYRNGALVTTSIASQIAALRTLREAKEPLTWYPWWGSSYSVHMTKYEWVEVRDEGEDITDPGAVIVSVGLQVV